MVRRSGAPKAVSSATSNRSSAAATSLPSPPNQIKSRLPHSSRGDEDQPEMDVIPNDDQRQRPLLGDDESANHRHDPNRTPSSMAPSVTNTTWARRNQWILFALASGACAAINGVFAKLTTTELTSSFSQGVARFFHLSAFGSAIEVAVRAIFFSLNLIFNGVMWTLFTTALSRGNSTTQVSIMNTSSNFVITAVLGLAIFSESLPPLWWLGAAMLVAGNVIIGRKDEGDAKGKDNLNSDAASVASAISLAEDGLGGHRHAS